MITPRENEGLEPKKPDFIEYDTLIYNISRQIYSRLPPQVTAVIDIDDLYQEARLRVALLDASDKARSVSIKRIAYGACIDFLRKLSILSRDYVRYARIVDNFYGDKNHMPTDEEFAQLINVDPQTVEKILSVIYRSRFSSLGDESLSNIQDRNIATPEENAIADEIMRLIEGVLNDDELSILEQYIDDIPLDKIRTANNISPSGICQILRKVRGKIKKRLRKHGIFVENRGKPRSRFNWHGFIDIQKIILDILKQSSSECPVVILHAVKKKLVAGGYIKGHSDELVPVRGMVHDALIKLESMGYHIRYQTGRSRHEGRAIWLEK